LEEAFTSISELTNKRTKSKAGILKKTIENIRAKNEKNIMT
jgi:hypothetical protein